MIWYSYKKNGAQDHFSPFVKGKLKGDSGKMDGGSLKPIAYSLLNP